MADDEAAIRSRVAAHEDAFQSLLSLVPAKFYDPEHGAGQWNKRKQTKEEARQAKRAKLDPAQFDRRKEAILGTAQAETNGGDGGALSNGDAADGRNDSKGKGKGKAKADVAAQTELGAAQTKLNGKGKKAKAALTNGDASAAGQVNGKVAQKAAKKDKKQKKDKVRTGEQASVNEAATTNGTSSTAVNGDTRSVDAATADAAPAAVVGKGERAKNVAEMRARLAAKIESLRSKRKAPGSGVDGAPKSREAILAARRKREDARAERKRSDKAAAKATAAATAAAAEQKVALALQQDDNDDDNGDGEESDDEQVVDGIALNAVSAGVDGEGVRKRGKRDAKTALQYALAKRDRVQGMTAEQRAKVKDSDAWHKALLQAAGDKQGAKSVIRLASAKDRAAATGDDFAEALRGGVGADDGDDVARLRKAVKRQEQQKKKSEKEWRERLQNVARQKAVKQKNREQNLKDRRESKGKKGGHKKGVQASARPAGGKKDNKRKRAGFEGRK